MNGVRPQCLDPVLHQPVRTRLVALLAERGATTFNELKRALDITDGNLDAHIRKLDAAGYLAQRKSTGPGRAQTFYALTRSGRRALGRYVKALEGLLRI